MKKFTFIAVLALLVWACGGGNDSKEGTSKKKEDDKIDYSEISSGDINGAIVYKNCVACHLANGEGGVSGAKDLRESKLSVNERAELIHYGSENNPVMVGFGKNNILDPEEIKAVAEYTMKFK